jgi:hypothetical protein
VLRATTSSQGSGSAGTSDHLRQATRNVSATTSCATLGSVCRRAYAYTRGESSSNIALNRSLAPAPLTSGTVRQPPILTHALQQIETVAP